MSDAMLATIDWHVVSPDPVLAAQAYEHAWMQWSEVVHRERFDWFVELAWPRTVNIKPWSPYDVVCPRSDCKVGYQVKCVGKDGPDPPRRVGPRKPLIIPTEAGGEHWANWQARIHSRRWVAFTTAVRAWYRTYRPLNPLELYCIECEVHVWEECKL